MKPRRITQVSRTLDDYNKVNWEEVQKQKRDSKKNRPLSSKKKITTPRSSENIGGTVLGRVKNFEGWMENKSEAKRKKKGRQASITLLNIKPKAQWTFEEWEKTKDHSFIKSLTKEQLQLKFKEFQRENRKVGKLKSVQTKNEDWSSDRQKVRMIKTTYHCKSVKDKAKMMERVARGDNQKKVARSRYHDNMTEIMWAGRKVKLRKWHESMDFEQSNIVFAMDPQVGFREESGKFSRPQSPKHELEVPELRALRSGSHPYFSIPDFIMSSVVTSTPSANSEKKSYGWPDGPIADQDVVIAMTRPPPHNLLKKFLESQTIDLAYGLEQDKFIKGEEKYKVYHHLISMFCVDHGKPPPTHSQTDELTKMLERAMYKRFDLDRSGAMGQADFRNLVLGVPDIDAKELESALKNLMPTHTLGKADLVRFLNSRTTDLTFDMYDKTGSNKLDRDYLSLMVYDLVSKFDAYTSGIYPDEDESKNTTNLLVTKFSELYLQDNDKVISRELFRKLPSCLDPIKEPELENAFKADCRAMIVRAAEFHDKNLNENYVEDINARNFVNFLESTPVVLCFDALDEEDEGLVSASQLRKIADSAIRIYGKQIGVEIKPSEELENFKDVLQKSYQEKHPGDIIKRGEINDFSKCVLEMSNDIITKVLKKPVETKDFATFLKALPLQVAENRSDGLLTPIDIFHDVISMYNVAQGGYRLFPDETLNTTSFLADLVEKKGKGNYSASIILEELVDLKSELETAMREDMMELISAPTYIPTPTHQLGNRYDALPVLGKSTVSNLPLKRKQSVNTMLETIFSDDEGEVVDISDQVCRSIDIYSSLRSSANSSFAESVNEYDTNTAQAYDNGRTIDEVGIDNDSTTPLYRTASFEQLGKMSAIKEGKNELEPESDVDKSEISDQYYVLANHSNPEDPLLTRKQDKPNFLHTFANKKNIPCCIAVGLLLVVALIVLIVVMKN